MARFEVTAECGNVVRAGVGVFRPGDVILWPDAATKKGDVVPLKFAPLDSEARKLWDQSREVRIRLNKELAAKAAQDGKPFTPYPIPDAPPEATRPIAPEPEAKKGEPETAANAQGGQGKGQRAADK